MYADTRKGIAYAKNNVMRSAHALNASGDRAFTQVRLTYAKILV